MPSPSVSIIVPIYNVAPYIEECFSSIVQQTYTDIEVLLIDDCGTDSSIEIARHFYEQYSGPIRFRLIHHEHNRGLSAARNTGIQAATGEYILFLDSDDCLLPDSIQVLFDAINQKPDIDIAVGNYTCDAENHFNRLELGQGIYEDIIMDYYQQHGIYPMAWNKLCRTSFLRKHQLMFKEGILHEDLLWHFCVCCAANKMAVIDTPTYYYRTREGSIQTSTDAMRHYHYECISTLEKISYALKNGYSRKQTFDIINHELLRLYREPLFDKKISFAKHFYALLRQYPYWNQKDIWRFTHDFKRLLLHYHRVLPEPLGFFVFCKIIGKYYDK